MRRLRLSLLRLLQILFLTEHFNLSTPNNHIAKFISPEMFLTDIRFREKLPNAAIHQLDGKEISIPS
jgi:hypothetical protein